MRITFVGGGNMASALAGGLLKGGRVPATVLMIEPDDRQRARIALQFGVLALPAADEHLAGVPLVVWAVKPQAFAAAARPCAPFIAGALQLSVMAGIRTSALVAATGSARVVRAMPNTPALIGRGITGLHARAAVGQAERAAVEALFAPTGSTLWVAREEDLDAVTALSSSGPAYVFYFIEAMMQAGAEMGLPSAQARRLAQETFAGAAALAMQSDEPPDALRARVTSRGGTTHAAIASLDADGVKAAFVKALHAARARAEELGR